MDIARIQREFVEAQKHFIYLELHPTADGRVFAKTALQAAITVAPHRYNAGNICYMHPTMWNPGIHNLAFVIGRAAKWLTKYDIWRERGTWPGVQIRH
jgi:hypothetical protein